MVQDCLILGGDPWQSSPDAFPSFGLPVSMDLIRECIGRKGNPQLCGQHCVELHLIISGFVANEEFYNAKINVTTPITVMDAEGMRQRLYIFSMLNTNKRSYSTEPARSENIL